FNRDVEGKRLPAAKADVARLRVSLTSDLKAKTGEYLEKPLWALLNENQALTLAGASTVGMLGSPTGQGPLLAGSTLFHERLALPDARGTLPAPEGHSRQWWVDWITVWFLIGAGTLLMLGLFTRFSCVAAAGFLLTTYLLVPPFPWLPTPPAQEGNYLFVNKNVIELLALLTLATTASGRWFGVDALLHWMWQAMFGARPAPRPGVRRAA
ncbi:MAG TPA: DoxX family protein, partial [Gemmataceae bacterium]|nr:DoxX family protein [Gemmataceae bacterium]